MLVACLYKPWKLKDFMVFHLASKVKIHHVKMGPLHVINANEDIASVIIETQLFQIFNLSQDIWWCHTKKTWLLNVPQGRQGTLFNSGWIILKDIAYGIYSRINKYILL